MKRERLNFLIFWGQKSQAYGYIVTLRKMSLYVFFAVTISLPLAYSRSQESEPVMVKAYLDHVQSQLEKQRDVFNLYSQKNLDFYLNMIGEQALKTSQGDRCLASEFAFRFYAEHQQKLMTGSQGIIAYNIAACFKRQKNYVKMRDYLHIYLASITSTVDPGKVKSALIDYSNALSQDEGQVDLEKEFYFLQNLNVPDGAISYKYFASVQLFFRLGKHEQAVKHLETMVQAKKLEASDPKTIFLFSLGNIANKKYEDAYSKLLGGLSLVSDEEEKLKNLYRISLARLLMLLEMPQKAENFYQAVDEGNHEDVTYERIVALIKAENFVKALSVAEKYGASTYGSGALFKIRLLIPYLLTHTGNYAKALSLATENISTLKNMRKEIDGGLNQKLFAFINAVLGEEQAWYVMEASKPVKLELATLKNLFKLNQELLRTKKRLDLTWFEVANVGDFQLYPSAARRIESLRPIVKSVIEAGQSIIDHMVTISESIDPVKAQKIQFLKQRGSKIIGSDIRSNATFKELGDQFMSQRFLNYAQMLKIKHQSLSAELSALKTYNTHASDQEIQSIGKNLISVNTEWKEILSRVAATRIKELSQKNPMSRDRKIFVLAIDAIWEQWLTLQLDESSANISIQYYAKIMSKWRNTTRSILEIYSEVEENNQAYLKSLNQGLEKASEDYRQISQTMDYLNANLGENNKKNIDFIKREIFKIIDAAIGKQIKWQGDIRYNLSGHAMERMQELSIWHELKLDEIREDEMRTKLWRQDLWLN